MSDPRRPDRRAIALSTLALIAARIMSMGLGFVAWIVAARLFMPADVGVASALVAAMMLCVQLGLLGIGSAIVIQLPRHRELRLIDTGATVVILAAIVVSLGFVLLAATLLTEVKIAASPAYAALFIVMTAFGTLNTYFDYVSVALRRGDQVLVRNGAFGFATILVLAIAGSVAPSASGTLVILAAWSSAAIAACLIAMVQTYRVTGHLPSLRWDMSAVQSLIGDGWGNWLLTLTERAPALVMPVLITQLIGPTTNAFWYAAWMMAWVAFIIPISSGQTMYAEIARHSAAERGIVVRGLRGSLLLAVLVAVALALAADPGLALLGSQYAESSADALRLLVVAVLPMSAIQAYYAVSRARRRLREAIALGLTGGVITVAVALAVGMAGGLLQMAGAWVVAQGVVGTWAALRLRALLRSDDGTPPRTVNAL